MSSSTLNWDCINDSISDFQLPKSQDRHYRGVNHRLPIQRTKVQIGRIEPVDISLESGPISVLLRKDCRRNESGYDYEIGEYTVTLVNRKPNDASGRTSFT